jgi:hypothetical protein
MDIGSVWATNGFLALHVGAIACACGTRVAVGSRCERSFQGLFLFALGAVGMATWFCRSASLGLGIPSGMTLVAMILVAVTDFRRPHESTHTRSLAVHR